MSDLPFSHYVRVADLPPEGRTFRIEPNAPILEALARHADVVQIHALSASLKVVPTSGDGARVTGEVAATVRQVSVVSLQAFDCDVVEEVDVTFLPESAIPDTPPATEEDVDVDLPDPIVDGRIDLGALVTEFLTLGVDPYPRLAGEVFVAPLDDEASASPFAALRRLKDKD